MSCSAGGNTVIVVDDDPFQLKLVSHLLVIHEVDTTCFLAGAEALAYLHERDGENILILLDLDMPQMDGVEFVRYLVERNFSGAVAFLSGQDRRVLESAGRLVKAHHLNFMGILDKPVKQEAIASVLHEWRLHKVENTARMPKTYGAEEVRRAIVSGELVNFYQPKVALKNGDIVGVETLVRWQHPTDGLVFPDQFIDVAEENGLIDMLTHSVLDMSLDMVIAWRRQNLDIGVAVNVSMDNLKRIDFPDLVQSALLRTGVGPTHLILEITESRLTQDARLPLDILTRLRLKQVSLSIDDFGTGHSSLSQLRDLPFDQLKIDRSFVHGANRDETLSSILQATLTMAEQLGMNVVAEGLEDLEDWNFLRGSGCAYAQGYFIARPMPANALPAWCLEWAARREGLCPR